MDRPIHNTMFWLMFALLVGRLGMDAYDYHTVERPIKQCAEKAKQSPTGVATCPVGKAQVTIVTRRDGAQDQLWTKPEAATLKGKDLT